LDNPHILADLLNKAVLESKYPAVIVVVAATVGQLVASRVLHYHEVAVSMDAVNLDAG
jgi:hypothetical protein